MKTDSDCTYNFGSNCTCDLNHNEEILAIICIQSKMEGKITVLKW